MPVYWTPAWVQIEADSRDDAAFRMTEIWPSEGAGYSLPEGVTVYVMGDDDDIEEGCLTDEEQAAQDEWADRAAVWGFAPAPEQILAKRRALEAER